MRYRYDRRVAITGLILGAVVLVGGLLAGDRETAGAIAVAIIVTSTLVAYVRVPNRPDGTGGGAAGAADRQGPVVSARTAMAALRPLRAITDPAGWVAAPHR